ncbi:hypothetical protein TWF481_004431 [Arthrobotrys musiformis]|uniref:Uncharacterized protein n=1 Tax=Arthrobotrys musiformis TaxID=47236 RepID=A0AAV9WJI6_9PEZI
MKVLIAASCLLGFSRPILGLYINDEKFINQERSIALQLSSRDALNSSLVPDLVPPKLLQKRQLFGDGTNSEDSYDPFAIEDSIASSSSLPEDNADSNSQDYDPFAIEDSSSVGEDNIVNGRSRSPSIGSAISEESVARAPIVDEAELLPHGYRPSRSESSLFEESIQSTPARMIEEDVGNDQFQPLDVDAAGLDSGLEDNIPDYGPGVGIADNILNYDLGFGTGNDVPDYGSGLNTGYPAVDSQRMDEYSDADTPSPIGRSYVSSDHEIEEEFQDEIIPNDATGETLAQNMGNTPTMALVTEEIIRDPIFQGSQPVQFSGLGDLGQRYTLPWTTDVFNAPAEGGGANTNLEMTEAISDPRPQDVQSLGPDLNRMVNDLPSYLLDPFSSRPGQKTIQEDLEFIETEEPAESDGKRRKGWLGGKSRGGNTASKRPPASHLEGDFVALDDSFDEGFGERFGGSDRQETGAAGTSGRKFVKGDPRARLPAKPVPRKPETIELENIAPDELQPAILENVEPEVVEIQPSPENLLSQDLNIPSQSPDKEQGRRDLYNLAVSKCSRLVEVDRDYPLLDLHFEHYLEFLDWWGAVDTSDRPYPSYQSIKETPGSMWDPSANYLDAFDREYGLGEYSNVGPDYEFITDDKVNTRRLKYKGRYHEHQGDFERPSAKEISLEVDSYGCKSLVYEQRKICQLKATSASIATKELRRRQREDGRDNVGRYLLTDGQYAGLQKRDYQVLDKLSIIRGTHNTLHWRYRACGVIRPRGLAKTYDLVDLYFDIELAIGGPTPDKLVKGSFGAPPPTLKGTITMPYIVPGSFNVGPPPKERGKWTRLKSFDSVPVDAECLRDMLKSPEFPRSCRDLWDNGLREKFQKSQKPWNMGPLKDRNLMPYFRDLEPIPEWQRATESTEGSWKTGDQVSIVLQPPISKRGRAEERSKSSNQ